MYSSEAQPEKSQSVQHKGKQRKELKTSVMEKSSRKMYVA